jgi:hypothetical protein
MVRSLLGRQRELKRKQENEREENMEMVRLMMAVFSADAFEVGRLLNRD